VKLWLASLLAAAAATAAVLA